MTRSISRSANAINLPIVDVLHPDGRINCPAVPELDGLDRFERGKKQRSYCGTEERLRKRSPTKTMSDSVIAAMCRSSRGISEQWFLRYPKTKEGPGCRARSSDPILSPALGEGLRAMAGEHSDWCISRQVWWGHRIPAWYGDNEEIRSLCRH